MDSLFLLTSGVALLQLTVATLMHSGLSPNKWLVCFVKAALGKGVNFHQDHLKKKHPLFSVFPQTGKIMCLCHIMQYLSLKSLVLLPSCNRERRKAAANTV